MRKRLKQRKGRMSRSRRHTPISGICGTRESNKQFKVQEHRRERRAVKQRLQVEQEEMPHPKEYGNEWDSPRDGKMWFGDMIGHAVPGWVATVWYGYDIEECIKERQKEYRKLMRK